MELIFIADFKFSEMMMYDGLTLIEQDLKEIIDSNLEHTGIMYRLYSRIKTKNSIHEKIIRKGYKENGNQVQDIIGLRILTYFGEDIDILIEHFSGVFEVVNLEYDNPDITEFSPVRINLVCKLPEEMQKEFNNWRNCHMHVSKFLDSTFEIQIRTTFSEGWHEIEHQMRYKCKEDWRELETESRLLNGIYATLDTSDHMLSRLFDETAYQHYKSRNWTAMLRTKFRLRFDTEDLSFSIHSLFNRNKEIAKCFFKLERKVVLKKLLHHSFGMDITFTNLVFLCNFFFVKNEEILHITPLPLLHQFKSHMVSVPKDVIA